MKTMKRAMIIMATAATIAAFAGCGSTDVVARFANESFAAVIAASGSNVAWADEEQAWSLSSPSGDLFLLSPDFSRNNAGAVDLDKPDAEFVFEAAPFVAAGLDVAKLPSVDGIKYEIEDGKFMLHFELGSDRFSPDASKSAEAAFAELVKFQRSRVGYHAQLDHYGIKLGNGNMFEWAKDMTKNDKDIVFVLDPAPFVAAGVEPAKVEGWIYAKVETMDDAGKTIMVDKLLKPFNLK